MEEPSSARQIAKFEAWLRADPAHLRAYRELDAIGVVGERSTLSSTAPTMAEQPRRGLVMATVALVALVGASWWAVQERSPGFTAVANRSAAVRGYRLADGTKVMLDAGAAIAVPSDAATAVVQLTQGRMRLAVQRSGAPPLRVDTSAGPIFVTAGLLDLIAGRDGLRVRVLRGAARLGRGSSARALAGPAAAAVLQTGQVAPDPRPAEPNWPEARVAFERVALRDVVARANRSGGPERLAADAAVAAMPVTGVLDLRDRPALARKLATALGLAVERRGAVLLLRR